MASSKSQKVSVSQTRTSSRIAANNEKDMIAQTKQLTVSKKTVKKTAKSNEAPTKSKNQPNIGRPRKRKADEPEDKARSKARKVERINPPTKTSARRTGRSKTKPARAVPTLSIDRPTQILKVFVFGSNQQGELGLGEGASANDVKRPRFNPHLDPQKIGVVQVAAGAMHTAVLTHDNKIYTWGVNDLGALGRGTDWEGGLKEMDAEDHSDTDSSEGALNPKESTPTAVDFSSLRPLPEFVKIAAGDNATFALASDGSVYGWGTFKVQTPTYAPLLKTNIDLGF